MKMKMILLPYLLLSLATPLAATFPRTRENIYCRTNSTWIGPASGAGVPLPQHSPYQNTETDGKDLGAGIDAIMQHMQLLE